LFSSEEKRIMTAPIPHAQFSDLTGPGWTPERKVAFLDHLAQKGNVRAACARVGLSRERQPWPVRTLGPFG
jgi:hypothetical protein